MKLRESVSGRRFAGLLLGLLLLGLALGPALSQQVEPSPGGTKPGSTLYVQTDGGTLKIETTDDDVQVIVEKNGKQIEVIDRKKGTKVALISGSYKPPEGGAPGEIKVHGDNIQITRDGTVVATLRKVKEAVVLRPKEPVGSQPPDSGKYVTNSIGMKLAPIAAGEFLMGMSAADFQRLKEQPSGYYRGLNGPDAMEGPQHKVKITKDYLLGAYLVTQAQYEKVMGTNPSWFSANGKDKDKVAGLDTSQFPVDSANWFDAVAFCKKLSELPDEKKAGRVYRLPTEAEWEYACRAGTTTTTAFGNTLSSKQANIDGEHPLGDTEKAPKIGRTVNVGSYPPNAWGLYDMHGNLWQWCLDGPRTYTAEAATDPRGPDMTLDPRTNEQVPARMLRGGCWRDGGVSASFRKPRQPELYRIHIVGFRVLCER
jgi:formylglycine-generating enzyme required for sulfatase activity